MSRIPASAGVALAGLLPLCAAALGLGEVESKSYLNQPLAAEIPVFAEAPGELAGLNVSLASPDTFSQYGLPRPTFLGDLAFSVAPGPRGGVIRITSARPVTEPFVTLLLEVQWPQGRLLREYTVLLDPPAFTGGAVRQPVQAPAASPPPPAAPQVPAMPGEAPASAAGGTHTVARNETLWGIADRYRPQGGADINQVMMAIYRANPEAFAGNINRLNAGAVLRIPDQAAVAAQGRDEADSEVRRQNEAWQGSAAAATAAPARLELVPPAESAVPAGQASAAGAAATAPKPSAEAEESRRLLAVKDAELQALRKRVAELEKQGGEAAVEPAPAPPTPPAAASAPEAAPVAEATPEAGPEATPEAAAEAPAAAEAAKPAKPAKPVRARPPADKPKAEGGGIGATIGQLLTSVWLWVTAAVVLVGALLLARRRSAGEETPPWRPTTRGRDEDGGDAGRGEDMIVIEEPSRAQATGGFERRATPRGDEESPLERTISTDGPVNLDQSDPLAEADFHMAYGLYDQAADLLTAAIGREPARRDLQLKLLDVYFVWENRDGFLKEAKALRERVGTDGDPDWKRVIIMGKQLCPGEALFAGAAVPDAEDMDLAFGGDGGGTVDLDLGGIDGGIDFDLSDGGDAEADANAPTKVARPWNSAQTQEIPTIEAPGPDMVPTMETPTLESPDLSASTMETPTIQTRAPGRTLEAPTIEAPELGGTARMEGLGASDERHDQTAEIDLEDLGLDLTGLDDAARDMSTGLQEALPGDGDLDFDLSEAGGAADGEESTAEMAGAPTLDEITNAMDKSGLAPRGPQVDDTAEQPGMGGDAGSSMLTQRLSATSDELQSLDIDLNLSEADEAGTDLTATGLRAISARRPEDPTMTEVGTKLDLARAYVDMGDPDGARSILNEVLEEGDPEQRQEARQLLDGLDG